MRSINLLPPEALEKAKVRRQRSLWVLAGIAYLVLLGVATFWWQGRVSDKNDLLVEEQAATEQLRGEVATLAPFEDLQLQFLAAEGILTSVLANDVAWGRLLNDLGRLIPDRVWLDGFSATVNPASGALGEVQVSGTAFDFPDVASWLRSLESDNFPSVSNTWVTNLTESAIGSARVVSFTSSTFLTDRALSDRLQRRLPDLS